MSWVKYLDKRKYCVGIELSTLVYIGILVTSTTTGGSVVSALASQAKGRWFNPFSPMNFSILPFQPLIYVRSSKYLNGNGLPICPPR